MAIEELDISTHVKRRFYFSASDYIERYLKDYKTRSTKIKSIEKKRGRLYNMNHDKR
jgi:hypothetical protein